MALLNTSLTTTAQSIFQNTAGNTAISTIHLCNYSDITQVVSLYAVPSGGVANSTTIIYSNVSILPNDTLIVATEQIILSAAGDAIMANCGNVNSVTATVSTRGV